MADTERYAAGVDYAAMTQDEIGREWQRAATRVQFAVKRQATARAALQAEKERLAEELAGLDAEVKGLDQATAVQTYHARQTLLRIVEARPELRKSAKAKSVELLGVQVGTHRQSPKLILRPDVPMEALLAYLPDCVRVKRELDRKRLAKRIEVCEDGSVRDLGFIDTETGEQLLLSDAMVAEAFEGQAAFDEPFVAADGVRIASGDVLTGEAPAAENEEEAEGDE